MKDKDYFSKFILAGDFSEEKLNEMKSILSLNNNQIIAKTFKYLNSELKIVIDDDFFYTAIYNSIQLLEIICKETIFTDSEVLINRKRIKKVRETLLSTAYDLDENFFLQMANKVDELVLDKSMKEEDLIKLIKKLVDRKEDVNIIKKILNTNKGVLSLDNGILFDYAFQKSLNSLQENTPDIYYYITLLKIFYYSEINKKKYIERLNKVSDDTNEFANEIYNIIHGNKRSLKPEEVLRKYGFVQEPSTILIPSFDIATVSDYTITIDGEGTLLRDDAFSIKKDGNNYIVGIHIADPASFVKPNSVLDIELRNNYKAIYTGDDVIELFSPSMNKALSLDKNEYRRTLSIYAVLNSSGDLVDYTIKKDIIRPNENLSFEYCDSLLDSHNDPFSKNVGNLYTLSGLLESKNPEKNYYWMLKENDSIDKEVTSHKSDKIVSELMVLYNYLMATYMYESGHIFIFRSQFDSYLEKMIKKLNINLDDNTKNIIKSIYLRSAYSIIPRYHNGLKLNKYAQVTRPLGRYPDLFNQYLIHDAVFHDIVIDIDYKELEMLIEYFNQRNIEIALMRSEYARSLKLKKVS